MAFNANNPNHLLIGLGGTGGKILKAFKKRLYSEFPDDDKRNRMTPAIAFLYVDSTREMMNDDHKDSSWRVLGEDVTFTNSEFCNIRPQSRGIGEILDSVDDYPGMKHMVKNASAMKSTLGEIKTAAGQKRRAGRIMFASSVPMFIGALSRKYDELRTQTNDSSLHVHIFTGLAGGTGSGSIIDVVAQTRKKYPDATIDVYAMVPEKDIPGELQAGRYHQNGYAALMELNAMNVCRYMPSDILTGEEHISFNNPDLLKQFSLMLFSNVNDNGMVIPSTLKQTTHGNSEDELIHTLVADAVYFRIFLRCTPATNTFFRAWSCENLEEHQVEYDTKSKKEDKVRARTKAISTFGIKRIVFPEKRIIQRITLSTTVKVIWQMQYNNFKEEGEGYKNESDRNDYSEITHDVNLLRQWKLDDSHLTLNEKILETDRDVSSFSEFWDDTVRFYNHDDAKANDPQPIDYLEEYCRSTYNSDFRLKLGVEGYFKDKAADKPLRQQSGAIVDAIERYLYSKWYSGQLSMMDLIGYCDEILGLINKKLDSIEGKRGELAEKIEAIENDLVANKSEYNNTNIFGRVIGRKAEIYSDHQTLLAEKYVTKTQLEAKAFESRLLLRLKNDFEEFSKELNDFLGKLQETQKAIVSAISERTRKNDAINMNNIIIEVNKEAKMIEFEEVLHADRTKMDNLASLLRKKIVNNQEFAHFGDVAKTISENTISDIAEKILTPQILIYHNSYERYKRNPIVGINVLEQVKKFIDEDSDLNLDIFTSRIINQCGEFLEFNTNELNKALNNNPNPLMRPESMNRRAIIISMPDYTANDQLREFGNKLENSFRAAFGVNSPNDTITFDYSSDKTNEITVVQVRSCFPIRALAWLPQFKNEYNELVNSPNEVDRKQNTIMLHCEGDGKQLPCLEGEPEAPKGDALVKYFFLAASMGIIKQGQDSESEEEGWCTVVEDTWGNESLKCISKQFTKLKESEVIDNKLRDELVFKVDLKLNDSEFKKSQRDACADFIKKMMQTTVKEEATSTTSPLYKAQGDAAMEAINILIKK